MRVLYTVLREGRTLATHFFPALLLCAGCAALAASFLSGVRASPFTIQIGEGLALIILLPACALLLRPRNLVSLCFYLLGATLWREALAGGAVPRVQCLCGLGLGGVLAAVLVEHYLQAQVRALSLRFYANLWALPYPQIAAVLREQLLHPKFPQALLKQIDPVYERSALHWAALRGQHENVLLLLRRDPGLQFQEDADQRRPLDLAVIANQVETVRLLLKFGSTIRHLDHRLYSSLHHALAQPSLIGAMVLLEEQGPPLPVAQLDSVIHSILRSDAWDPLELLIRHRKTRRVMARNLDRYQQLSRHWGAKHCRTLLAPERFNSIQP